jgi:hypothetical protein
MDIKTFLAAWIEVSNSYNTKQYLDKYAKDAVLDDPSVGKKFVGHKGIKAYYTSYFIGYKTQTRLLKIKTGNNSAYIEVAFTGEFPEGKIKGSFDFTFEAEKIKTVKADLI